MQTTGSEECNAQVSQVLLLPTKSTGNLRAVSKTTSHVKSDEPGVLNLVGVT